MILRLNLNLLLALFLLLPHSAHADPLAAQPLAQLLGGGAAIAPAELPRLLDIAEVVAFRDQTRGLSAQSITYAATLERNLDGYLQKSVRPARALAELAIALGGLERLGPERVYPLLLAALNLKPAEAKPRPELGRELAELGEWSAATLEKLAPRLGPAEFSSARIRLALERGRYADAARLARGHNDPRSAAWLGAALLLDGATAEAAPLLGHALAAGGEPAAIARAARTRRAHRDAADKIQRALGTSAPGEACRKLFGDPSGRAGGDVALACAALLWDEPDRGWLPRAAALAPNGAAGAHVRAAAALALLFSSPRPEELGRAGLRSRFVAELARLDVTADERRALSLLVELAAADDPTHFTTPENAKLIGELDRAAPCDAATFPLRALALRGDPPALGGFASSVARRCTSAPGGGPIAVDALGVLQQLAHESPPAVRGDVVDQLAAALAKARPDDPAAIGAHADAVALRALAGQAPPFALTAALSRYEDAIARATPAGGAPLRARLEANAGFLSTLLSEKQPASVRQQLVERALGHLRFALALDEHNAAITATRAHLDGLLGLPLGARPPDPAQLPPGPGGGRARAACLLAEQAALTADAAAFKRYLPAARSDSAARYDADELLVTTRAPLEIALDERALHPAAQLHTDLFLAPRCDPSALKLRAASSAPAPRTAPGR